MNMGEDNIKSEYIEDLVSIIMPAYNCCDFIGQAIESVIKQTYKNWELIIVDDCSLDSTLETIENFAEREERIILKKNEKNHGAAYSRNKAIKYARGEYIAFLDSDDLWDEGKLEKQLDFMKKQAISFSCTYYRKINEKSEKTGEYIKNKSKIFYKDLLKNCPGNSTVMYNAKILGKTYIPDIKKRNDYVMWLKVIKKAGHMETMNKVLGSHRIREGSLSKNKTDLIKYHWHVYRKIEKLNFIYTIYLIIYWGIKGIKRNIGMKKR